MGRGRFEAETGIRESQWIGRYWVRWGDAVVEAGFAPNELQGKVNTDEELLTLLADLTRELDSFPTDAQMRIRTRDEGGFPSTTTFKVRFGNRAQKVAKLAEFCASRPDFGDVLLILEPEAKKHAHAESIGAVADTAGEVVDGHVYLLRSGRNYKLGRTNDIGRRSYELSIQLPERATLVHSIRTDDPVGIERYWHERFAAKRLNGEWFALSKEDVTAFKRRQKFM